MPRPHALALRLGVGINNEAGFAIGLDVTPSRWSLVPNLATRFTLEYLAPARHEIALSSVVAAGSFTLDQVYQSPNHTGVNPYAGIGVGIYTGPYGAQNGDGFLGPTYHDTAVFGGKLFVNEYLNDGNSLLL